MVSIEEKRQLRKEYMRLYRLKNRARLNAYHREYLSDPDHARKHRESCDKYRATNMTEETKAKIRAYQHEYYLKRKATKDQEKLNGGEV